MCGVTVVVQHDHLKSPQDPCAVVVLSSPVPKAQATACLSTWLPVVVGQLTRWLQDENCENTHGTHISSTLDKTSAEMTPPVESKTPFFFHKNWVWKCCFRCLCAWFMLSVKILTTFPNLQIYNLCELLLWINNNTWGDCSLKRSGFRSIMSALCSFGGNIF